MEQNTTVFGAASVTRDALFGGLTDEHPRFSA